MRLRNKKTEEIVDVYNIYISKRVEDDSLTSHENVIRSFDSIAELNEELEDYKPTEPLIKDEKIRKAVRAWAEVNKTNHVWVSAASDGINITQDEQYPPSTKYKQSITFECEVEFKSDYYTIAELCGEGEE